MIIYLSVALSYFCFFRVVQVIWKTAKDDIAIVQRKTLGLNTANDVTGLNLVRIQYNPTATQFRSCLRDCLAHALNTGRVSETEASVDGHVTVVYAGQVMSHTGEWLLADCALDGHQVLSWLDSKAARAWWPQLDKFPSMGDRLHVHLFTPLAGPGTTWPVSKNGHPQTLLTHVDVRLVDLALNVEGSWRSGGKPVVLDPNHGAAYEGIRSFVQLAMDHHPSTVLSLTSDSTPLGCALSAQRPALYFFPGGGITSQASALFSIQGFTMLLGGAFTSNKPPNWWAMIRNLPKLDAVVLPDWSASNLLTYQFLLDVLKSGTPESNVLGAILLPPPYTPSSPDELTNEFTLSQPTSASVAHESTWAPNNLATENLPPPLVLYAKFGWGELKLQPLAQRAGLVVLWSSRLDQPANNSNPPLRILLPTTQLSGASPVQGLGRLIKSLATVPQLEDKSITMKSSAKPLSTRTTALKTSPQQPRVQSTTNKPMGNHTPSKPLRDASPRKPVAAQSKRPISANTAHPNKATAPATKAPTRPQTAHTPTKVLNSTKPASAKTTSSVPPPRPSSVKAKNETTAQKLAAHANLLASKKTVSATPAAPKSKPIVTSAATPTSKIPPSLTSKPKAQSPLPEEPHQEVAPTTTVLENSPHETPTNAEQLRDSLELAAVDPLMSGWRSMEQSETRVAPVSESVQEPQPTKDSYNAEVGAPEPAELYKVHKFEHFDEADEMEETSIPERNQYSGLDFEGEQQSYEDRPVDEDILEPVGHEKREDEAAHFTQTGEDQYAEPKVYEQSVSEVDASEQFETADPSVASVLKLIDPATESSDPNKLDTSDLGEENPSLQTSAPADSLLASPSVPHSVTNEVFTDEQMHDVAHEEPPVEVDESVEKVDESKVESFVPGYFERAEDSRQVGVEPPRGLSSLTGTEINVRPDSFAEMFVPGYGVSDELKQHAMPGEAYDASPNETRVGHFEHVSVSPSSMDENTTHLASHLEYPEEKPGFGSPLEKSANAVLEKLETEMVHASTEGPDESHLSYYDQQVSQPSPVRPDSLDGSDAASLPLRAPHDSEWCSPDLTSDAVHHEFPTSTHLDKSEPFTFDAVDHPSDHLELRTDSLEDIVPSDKEDAPQHLPEGVGSPVTTSDAEPIQDHRFLTQEIDVDAGLEYDHKGQPTHATNVSEPDIAQNRQAVMDLSKAVDSPEDYPATVASDHPFAASTGYLTLGEGVDLEQINVMDKSPSSRENVYHEYAISDEPETQIAPKFNLAVDENTILTPSTDLEPAADRYPDQPLEEFPDYTSVREGGDYGSPTAMDKSSFTGKDIPHEQYAADVPEAQPEHDSKLTEADYAVLATPTEQEIPVSRPPQQNEYSLTQENVEYDESNFMDKLPSPENGVHLHDTVPDVLGTQQWDQPEGTGNDSDQISSRAFETHSSISPEQYVEEATDHVPTKEDDGLDVMHTSPLVTQDIHVQDVPFTTPEPLGAHDLEATEDEREIPSSFEAFETQSDMHPEKQVGEPAKHSQNEDDVADYMHSDFVQERPANGSFSLLGATIPYMPDTQLPQEPTTEMPYDAFSSTVSTHLERNVYDVADFAPPERNAESTKVFGSPGWPANEEDVPPLTPRDHGSDISDLDDNDREFLASGKAVASGPQYYPGKQSPGVPESSDERFDQEAHEDNSKWIADEADTAPEELVENLHSETVEERPPEQMSDYLPESHPAFSMYGSDQSPHIASADTLDDEIPASYHPASFPQSFLSDTDVVHSTTSPAELPAAHDQVSFGHSDEMGASHLEFEHQLQQPADSTTVDGGAIIDCATALNDSEPVRDLSPLTLDATGDHLDDQHYLASPLSEASVDSVVRGPTDNTGPAAVSSTQPEETSDSVLEHSDTCLSTAQFAPDHHHLDAHENGTSDDPDVTSFTEPQMSVTNGVHTNGTASHFDDNWVEYGDLSPSANFKVTSGLTDAQALRKSMEFNEPQPAEDPQHTLHLTSPVSESGNSATLLGESPVSELPEQFDPLLAWGKPQGLPAPVVPASTTRGAITKTAAPTRSTPSGRLGIASKSQAPASAKSATPPVLPPGPPVFLDLIWVPTYLPRVPHEMAVEFFSRVRARTYVLSGEALHPMIGEALLEGKSKWGPHDVEHLCRTSSSDTTPNTITILPTDEPYEWTCWLRTPCGRLDRETGESRLQASGFHVLPAASLCDIEYSAGNVAFRCEGVRVDF
ncbi:hypothetical protein CRM22_010682 [Opisthorchis felineus]|uniref:Microtubule-associated protein 1A/B/S-like MBL-like domain-containing protein n=1 Tax=Opisthorchis felineus TaxID=147828 RepID=A0A4S2KR45_OPIFE|nr:hypothetical protein CRM22_010682 [Opisthorchis felineus]